MPAIAVAIATAVSAVVRVGLGYTVAVSKCAGAAGKELAAVFLAELALEPFGGVCRARVGRVGSKVRSPSMAQLLHVMVRM